MFIRLNLLHLSVGNVLVKSPRTYISLVREVEVMRWRHSVFFTHGACRMMSKDVRTLYRFRFIYYLFKQDKAKYFEVIKVLFRNEFYGDHRTVHYILSKSPALTGDYRI